MTARVLNKAYNDLAEIWNYIAKNNRPAADRLEEQIFDAMKLLGQHPGFGHQRSDVSNERFRFWRVGNYLIAYKIGVTDVIIYRVVHAARDFRKLF